MRRARISDKEVMEALSLTAYETTAVMFFIITLRYLIVSGTFYFVLKRPRWQHKRIHPDPPRREQLVQEIGWSIVSCLIFALSGTAGDLAWKAGYTQVYLDVHRHGIAYLLLSVPLLMFLHDTYFYFAHRLMHHKVLFDRVHKVHHLSRNPSPWASFCFHPFEAFVEALILPLLILVVPVHPIALLIFVTVMSVFGVVNHTGYELYSKEFVTNRWLSAWLTVTHHQMHHTHYRTNFGLYFTLWDRWLGTEHAKYAATFLRVKAQRSLVPAAAISPARLGLRLRPFARVAPRVVENAVHVGALEGMAAEVVTQTLDEVRG